MTKSQKSKSLIEKIKESFKKERFKIDLFDERIEFIIQIIGWLILIACIVYWIIMMFFIRDFEALLHTTLLTTILISFTCILKLESVFLNTISSISFFGFLNITIGLIPVTNSIAFLFVGPIYHGAIAIFQVFLVFHPKIPMSKKYLLWGALFYLAFMASYDNYQRLNVITGIEQLVPSSFTKAYAFYALIITTFGIYLYKKKFGILVN